jgi:3-oxoadipate enol-lactonase
MSSEGFFDVPEGKLFWRIDKPDGSIKTLPPILFIHAGVSDHTLWDDQVNFLTSKGFTTLRYDIIGFGQSELSKQYLSSYPLTKIDYIEHVAMLTKHHFQDSRVVAVGLSMGGGLAISLAITHPELVCGLVAIAAGISGFNASTDPREDAMSDEIQNLIETGNIETAAKLNTKFWGDGPLQAEGRCSSAVRNKLFNWCLLIADKEHKKVGGFVLPSVGLQPAAVERLEEIDVPVAVAIGDYDESYTVAAMEFLAKTCKNTEVKRFMSAHMVNLEFPSETNDWLYSWLLKTF